MKVLSKATKLQTLCLVLFATVLAGAPKPAYAVPSGQILRMLEARIFTNHCCLSWGETVKVTEPAVPVPVVVTWSVEYNGGFGFLVQLSVNGGPCQFYGPGSIFPSATGGTQVRTFHWIIFPGEGFPATKLHKGVNTFTICGGTSQDNQTMTIGPNTLSVRTSD